MRQLMISLDKKILDPSSAVAKRMVEYGKNDELFIIVPGIRVANLDLSSRVHVLSVGGGNKAVQLWNLYRSAYKAIKDYHLESITTQDPFFTGLVGVLLKRQFKISLEVQMHGDYYGPSDYYRWSSWIDQCRWWLGRAVIQEANQVRVVGERIKNNVINRLHIPPDKIIVRPVSTDYEFIKNYQPKLNLHNTYPGFKKIFLSLSRFDPVKNIPWLISVFAVIVKTHPQYGLVIVGEGLDEVNVKKNIEKLGLQKNVVVEDWINDPYSYLKTTDCLLFPSKSEGYGLAPMEAYAAGTPIIMNDVGVANYELKPSDKVRILPVNNRDKWIEAILSI